MVAVRAVILPTTEVYFLVKAAFSVTRVIPVASHYLLTYYSPCFCGINLGSGTEMCLPEISSHLSKE